MNRVLAELLDVERDQLESWLVEFDRTWDRARLDDSVDSLPFEDPDLRLATLTEMVKIDLERQWRSDRLLTVDDNLARFPELGTSETVTVDLIRVELDLRAEFGEPLNDQELAIRFPGRVDEIDDVDSGYELSPNTSLEDACSQDSAFCCGEFQTPTPIRNGSPFELFE